MLHLLFRISLNKNKGILTDKNKANVNWIKKAVKRNYYEIYTPEQSLY